MDGFPKELELSAPSWPEACREPRPGDLNHFLPQGFGLGAPPVIMPYGAADDSYYSFQKDAAHPFLNAPITDSKGGTIYFDDDAEQKSLDASLGLVGVYRTTEYVAFAASSEDPVQARYLDQLRFISTFALATLFGAPPTSAPKQSLDVFDAAFAFVQAQKEKWNDPRYAFGNKLSGKAGGDGDWAKESLAFGFHVENTYWGVYRMWSRPWLVTK